MPFDPCQKADIVRYMQAPCSEGLSFCKAFHTLAIDLTKSEETILSKIKKDTKYEIRRAESKDKIICRLLNSSEITNIEIQEFCRFHNQFARIKGLRPVNQRRLRSMWQTDMLQLSLARTPDGENLVWHAYISSGRRARLLYSSSQLHIARDSAFRSLIGRANRLLHWEDIMTYKKMRWSLYDLGGWYEGKVDTEKLRINKFKEEFGGNLHIEYNGMSFVSVKGKALKSSFALLLRLKHIV